MTINTNLLFESRLLAGLNVAARQDILSHVYELKFSAGQMVMLAHEPCQAVYLVAEGVLRAFYSSLEGREYVLAYLTRGDFFNADAALSAAGADSATESRFTVDTLTHATLYAIPCDRFRALVYQHPRLTIAMLNDLAAEVRRLSDMIEGLALHTVRARLARFLLTRADDKLPQRNWTQGDIAAHIGTVRDVVGRTLREFAREGLVRRERDRLVVTNQKALEREAMTSA